MTELPIACTPTTRTHIREEAMLYQAAIRVVVQHSADGTWFKTIPIGFLKGEPVLHSTEDAALKVAEKAVNVINLNFRASLMGWGWKPEE